MTDEKYYFDVSEEGQKGLNILDYLYNSSTQQFIMDAGLKPGMKILDIGCGLGTMTAWLANAVGPKGKVIAIDNNEHQVKATEKQVAENNLNNVTALCHSAYDLEALDETFDFIYCRFVLHHLIKPTEVINTVYNSLNDDGIFAAEEGIVNQAFTYPFTSAWGTERWHNDPKDHDTEGQTRDGNFGIKLYHVMHQAGFKDPTTKLVQPVMQGFDDKSHYLQGMHEGKRGFIESGGSEDEWNKRCEQMKVLVEDESAVIAFYQSCQVSGVK